MIDPQPIYEELSSKYELDVRVVEEVIKSQFKYTTQLMAEGYNKPIWLKYYGSFVPNKRYLAPCGSYLLEYNKELDCKICPKHRLNCNNYEDRAEGISN